MKRFGLFGLLLLAVACQPTDRDDDDDGGSVGRDAGYQGHPSQNILVERVLDGDTLIVSAGPTVRGPDSRPLDGQRVRLLGIDAPEIQHDDDPADCWGDESHAFLRDRIEGRIVTLEFDPTKCRPPAATDACRDDFDRLLAYVKYLGNTLNEDSLRLGHSRTFRGARFTHRDTAKYIDIEQQAQSSSSGLWSCP
ncbi:MAG: thermonuclease family protein [Deltaproteobacteria bacterium]|jgi:micrococcal nuclease